MSNTARKARKRAGIKLIREQRVGTPFLERAWVQGLHPGVPGTKWAGAHVPRSPKKVIKALQARTMKEEHEHGTVTGK